MITERITFHGHENVLGTHRNTIEITKEEHLTRRGDCIIGVLASKACADFDDRLKEHVQSSRAMRFTVSVAGNSFSFSGRGSPDLELSDHHEIVFRRSSFASPRTAAVHCDAAAIDIPRRIVRLLQNPGVVGELEIMALSVQVIAPETPPIDFAEG